MLLTIGFRGRPVRAAPDFRGRRVTVIGLGLEGVDLVRFLAAQGAEVVASDAKPPERLAASLNRLAGVKVRLALGRNDVVDTADAETVFVSQGVPLDLPAIAAARQRGVPISSMTRLFMELCPGTMVGITGSSGKSTVAALVGTMLRASGRPTVVGGNIGAPLLELLPRITPETWVVMEISHTQLELTERSPHVACVTNVTPNHLDRYSWDAYVGLKRNLLRYQGPGDVAVLNVDDPVVVSLREEVAGRLISTSLEREPEGEAVFLLGDHVVARWGGVEEMLFAARDVPLRGRHNLANAVSAAAVAVAGGADPGSVRAALRAFRPLPHRLELVRRFRGVAYYNDSIATTPERALAGLCTFPQPVVLLLGGREKKLPLEALAREALQRCRAVVCFGEAGDVLADAVGAAAIGRSSAPPVVRVETLGEAVERARALAHPGDVVLLSPACTSFDAYDNFEARGEDFRLRVRALNGEG